MTCLTHESQSTTPRKSFRGLELHSMEHSCAVSNRTRKCHPRKLLNGNAQSPAKPRQAHRAATQWKDSLHRHWATRPIARDAARLLGRGGDYASPPVRSTKTGGARPEGFLNGGGSACRGAKGPRDGLSTLGVLRSRELRWENALDALVNIRISGLAYYSVIYHSGTFSRPDPSTRIKSQRGGD